MPVTPTFAIEPHYYDWDEFWLLIEGDGEAWMDNRVYQYMANTADTTPGRHPSAPKFHGRALLGPAYAA